MESVWKLILGLNVNWIIFLNSFFFFSGILKICLKGQNYQRDHHEEEIYAKQYYFLADSKIV